jgi:hypothetical protein
MTTKSKLVLIVAVALSIDSSALAQSLNPGDGTGNNLPYCYGPGELGRGELRAPWSEISKHRPSERSRPSQP